MSRKAVDPVDAAFERITALDEAQYARLNERLIGWVRRNDPKPSTTTKRTRKAEATD